MCGHRVPPQSVIHFYSATKYAVTALTEGLRQELLEAQSHIRATVRLWSSPGGSVVGPALPPAHAQEGLLRAPGLNSAQGLGAALLSGTVASLHSPQRQRSDLHSEWERADLKGAWSGEAEGNHT